MHLWRKKDDTTEEKMRALLEKKGEVATEESEKTPEDIPVIVHEFWISLQDIRSAKKEKNEAWVELSDLSQRTQQRFSIARDPLFIEEKELQKHFGIFLNTILTGGATEDIGSICQALDLIKGQCAESKEQRSEKAKQWGNLKNTLKQLPGNIFHYGLVTLNYAIYLCYLIVPLTLPWLSSSLGSGGMMLVGLMMIEVLCWCLFFIYFPGIGKGDPGFFFISHLAGVALCMSAWGIAYQIGDFDKGTYFLTEKKSGVIIDVLRFDTCPSDRISICQIAGRRRASFLDNEVVQGFPTRDTIRIPLRKKTIVISYTVPLGKIKYRWREVPGSKIPEILTASSEEFIKRYSEESKTEKKIELKIKKEELLVGGLGEETMKQEVQEEQDRFTNGLREYLNKTEFPDKKIKEIGDLVTIEKITIE